MAERKANGQFEKNHARVEGSGMQKGQKVRSTEMVNRLFTFFENETIQEQLVQDWTDLEPKERWDVFTKCLKHMAPTVSSITFGDDKVVSSIHQHILNMANYRKENK